MAGGGLSTSEKLASKNPAQRAEGQRELSQQTSSQQKRTVSKAKQIASKPGVTGVVAPEEVQAPKKYWGTSSEEFGEVSETGKVIRTPEEIRAEQEMPKKEPTRAEELRRPTSPLFETPFERIQAQPMTPALPTKEVEVRTGVEGEFGGEAIRAAPKPRGIIDVTFQKAREFSFERQFRVPESDPFKRQALAFGAVGLAAVGTAGFIVTNPLEAGKGILQSVIKPKQTLIAITEKAKIAPELLVGELVGTAAVFKGVSVAIKAQPVRFRAAKIEAPGIKTTRVISVEAGAKAQPLLFVSKRRIGVGTPKLSLKEFTGELPLETATQAKVIERSLKVEAPLEAAKIKEIRGLVTETKAIKVKPLRKLPRVTEALEAPRIEKALEITRAEKGKLFGSFPQQAFVEKDFVRIVGDIDIKLPLPAEKVPIKTELFKTELEKLPGPKLEIKPEFPGVVQVKKGGRLLKGIELKPSEGVLPGEEIAPERFLSLQLTQRPTKVEGVLASRLSEQGLRKAASLGTLRRVEGKLTVGPKPRRFKDIPDFFRVQETLVGKKLFPRKARARLEKLKELFPEGAAEALKVKEPIKIELGRKPSPRPSKPSRVPSPSALSKRLSKSLRPSPSPSISPKFPSPSVSPSLSPSKSVSPSLSPSKSLSKFLSPSISPSLSKSLRPSVSPSISPSVSPSLASTLPKTISPTLPLLPQLAPQIMIGKKQLKRKFSYAPSLVALERRLKGPQRKLLTGIEIREITG